MSKEEDFHLVTICEDGIYAQEFFPEIQPEEFENDEWLFNRAYKEWCRMQDNARKLKVGWDFETDGKTFQMVSKNLNNTVFKAIEKNNKFIIKSVYICAAP